MAAFLGTIFVWEKWLPQSHRGQAPALNRQGGNVRVAVPYHVEFLFQNEYASYTGRSGRTSLCSRRSAGRGFFQLQKQTCQKLWPFSALEFEARLLLPSSSSKIKMSRTVRLRRTTWFPSANQFTESSVQTAFKSCGCFATALVWKAVFTPNWFCLMSPLSRRRSDFQKCGGSARSGLEKLVKSFNLITFNQNNA